jgi:hypothetical protein
VRRQFSDVTEGDAAGDGSGSGVHNCSLERRNEASP